MITVAEHSFEESLLWTGQSIKCDILDLGCRGFQFTNEMREMGYNVFPVDCDHLEGGDYIRCAVTDHDGTAEIVYCNDPQGTRIQKKRKMSRSQNDVVACTLKTLRDRLGIVIFDLIKFDIEGHEYEVIMSMGKAYSKQLSIEFHLHTGIYGDKEVKEMEDKLLSLGYFPVKHDKTRQHGLNPNFWDSLWILKDLI